MDYEKKYNSALERARNYYKGLAPCRAKDELELIFPELRESEDEMALRIIRKRMCYDPVPISDEDRRIVENWLEKQKEQKPASTEEMPYITDEHFYEREPADSFKYKLAEYMTKNCTKKESPYGYSYSINSESILQMAKDELLKRGVVQKPAEWSDYKDKVNVPYCSSEPEWSEEDEKNCNRIIRFLEPHKTFFPTKETKEEMQNWLKNRLKSLRPQPQREWSEEDEKMLDKVLDSVTYAFYDQGNEGEIEDDPAFLWLHRLRPRWNPSEEQMKELEIIVRYGDKESTHIKSLRDLYEQLKKL